MRIYGHAPEMFRDSLARVPKAPRQPCEPTMHRLIAPFMLLALGNVNAQTPPGQTKFEVASIKPSAPDFRGMFYQPQPGGLHVVAATIRDLLDYAYGVRWFSISGGPAWVGSDRFDIEA